MHKSTKVPFRLRRDIWKQYQEWMKIQVIADYYHIHRNTISKIIKRAKIWDFYVHRSTREDYRSLRYWLRKLDYIYDKIQRKLAKYWSIIRYEKENAWELVHIDVHKLKNVQGQNPKIKKYQAWIIDDCTRIGYSEVIPNKKAQTLALFLRRAYTWFKSKWIIIKAILCDNWKEFTTHRQVWKDKHIFARTCLELKMKQKFTRVRRPQTNGKIERFRRTCNTELFQKIQFLTRDEVEKSLDSYMIRYNFTRVHWSLWSPPFDKLQKLNSH